ncbi:MAG: ATP-binding protein [Nannocystaceae bacterium]
MKDPLGPESAYRHRQVARRIGLVCFVYCTSFGLGTLLLAGPTRAEELWDPLMTQISGLINVVAGVIALIGYVLLEHVPPRTPDPPRTYTRILYALLLVVLTYCLAHTHLGGSHSSIIIISVLLQLVLVTGFAARRHVPALLTLSLGATIVMYGLEFIGVLPYAPMLADHAAIDRVFLDWRWVLGDSLVFLSLASTVILVVWRCRAYFEQRQDELEARVHERTTELHRQAAQTRAAYEALAAEIARREEVEAARHRLDEQLERSRHAAIVGEVAGGIAHELNQPLGGILANAQAALSLLDASPPDLAEVRAALSDIVDDERRAAAVIDAVRMVARRTPHESAPVDVRDVVDQARAILSPMAEAAGIHLVFGDLPVGVRVWCTEVQLSQVLINLVRNAIEACARDDAVTIRCSYNDEHVQLAVRDTGKGFTPYALKRAFEPWVTTRPTGLGIGLSLCKRIVESHGGTIRADNNEDRGACVTIALQRYDAPEASGVRAYERDPRHHHLPGR